MPVTSLYTCTRCKKEFNFNSIKYDKDGYLICVECMNKRDAREKKEIKKEQPEDRGVVDFICLACRYKFSIKKGSSKELKCPYCGKTKLMLVKKYKDEDDLIKDSMNTKFDY